MKKNEVPNNQLQVQQQQQGKKVEVEEEEDIVFERLIEYLVIIGPGNDQEKIRRRDSSDNITVNSQSPSIDSPSTEFGSKEQSESQEFQERESQDSKEIRGSQDSKEIQENGESSENQQDSQNEGGTQQKITEDIGSQEQQQQQSSNEKIDTPPPNPEILITDEQTEEDKQNNFFRQFGNEYWIEDPICYVSIVKPYLGEQVRVFLSFINIFLLILIKKIIVPSRIRISIRLFKRICDKFKSRNFSKIKININ